MPPLVVYEGTDGVLVIYNGVTRATRLAKLAPGALVRVEVIGRLRRADGSDPTMCELSPDVRLGQLLAHLGFLGEDQTGRSLWNIDDEQMLAVLYSHRAELSDRQALAVPREGASS